MPEGCGRTVVPAQKQAQPGRGSSLSAFHLLQERGPEACCQVGRGLCSSKKQGKKNSVCFQWGSTPWVQVGPQVLLWHPVQLCQRHQLGLGLLPSKGVPLPQQDTQPPPPNLTGCMVSGFSHIGKKIQSLCRNSHPNSAASAVHPASIKLGGMRLVQPYPRI